MLKTPMGFTLQSFSVTWNLVSFSGTMPLLSFQLPSSFLSGRTEKMRTLFPRLTEKSSNNLRLQRFIPPLSAWNLFDQGLTYQTAKLTLLGCSASLELSPQPIFGISFPKPFLHEVFIDRNLFRLCRLSRALKIGLVTSLSQARLSALPRFSTFSSVALLWKDPYTLAYRFTSILNLSLPIVLWID
jgi:hypothetical protein